jgi:hypothetical protein
MHKLNILSLPEAKKTLPIQQLAVGISDKILAIFVNPYVFQVHAYISEKRITEYTESWRITEVRTGT